MSTLLIRCCILVRRFREEILYSSSSLRFYTSKYNLPTRQCISNKIITNYMIHLRMARRGRNMQCVCERNKKLKFSILKNQLRLAVPKRVSKQQKHFTVIVSNWLPMQDPPKIRAAQQFHICIFTVLNINISDYRAARISGVDSCIAESRFGAARSSVNVYRGSFPGSKAAWAWSWSLICSQCLVKKTLICTSTPPYAFMV
jgi:hypothetical protein